MWNVNFKFELNLIGLFSLKNSLYNIQHTKRALETQSILGGPDLKPFYGLIDGGREGEFFKEMRHLFYYSQLRK